MRSCFRHGSRCTIRMSKQVLRCQAGRVRPLHRSHRWGRSMPRLRSRRFRNRRDILRKRGGWPWGSGDPQALDELADLAYSELRPSPRDICTAKCPATRCKLPASSTSYPNADNPRDSVKVPSRGLKSTDFSSRCAGDEVYIAGLDVRQVGGDRRSHAQNLDRHVCDSVVDGHGYDWAAAFRKETALVFPPQTTTPTCSFGFGSYFFESRAAKAAAPPGSAATRKTSQSFSCAL